LYRVPIWAFDSTAGRFLNRSAVNEEEDGEGEEEEGVEDDRAEDFEVLEKVKTTAPNGIGKVVRRKKTARGR
jgi:hypothetical protein